jgi:microcystin-dependent protein
MDATTPQTSTGLAIGSVISYGGDLSVPANLQALKTAGWLPCDGTSYRQSDYPGLFAAIGTTSGGDAQSFNVPDLRDRFVRGANGNNTGSVQGGATALPASKPFTLESSGTHTHSVSHLNSDMHMAWSGSTYTMARWNQPANTDTGGAHSHAITGFDPATTPVNTALYFIIKASEPASADGSTPAGAISGFAGSAAAAADGWLACDGMAYGMDRFPNLGGMISYNYGGDGVSVFNVPDLRGQFLRGTSHSTGRDPDAAQRHALNTGGAAGDSTGSAQGYATARPAGLATASAGAHTHNISKVPHDDHHAAWGASGFAAFNCMVWTDAATTSTAAGDHTHTVVGGDTETRPANVSLQLQIASDNLASAPPVGSIMPIGGDTTVLSNLMALAAAGWLPCDGGKLRISDPTYAALYSVIGTTYGSASLQFFLPDLRGYFVTGAGGARGAGAVQNQSKAGPPVVPMTTSTDGSHLHSIPNIPTETHVIDVVAGVDLAENNPTATPTSQDGAHTHVLSGGDSETRPMNVNVDYVIRYR